MKLTQAPCELFALTAANGDALLLYGESESWIFLWPTALIERHRIAFARWCKGHAHLVLGKRVMVFHELDERTHRWANWCGVQIEPGERSGPYPHQFRLNEMRVN